MFLHFTMDRTAYLNRLRMGMRLGGVMGFVHRAAYVFLLSLLFVPPAIAGMKHGVAIIIGNKNYGNGMPSVDFAHNDATAIESFVRYRLGITDVISVREATKAKLDVLFGTEDNVRGVLAGRIRPGETDVVVFYSGHGMPGNVNEKAYLVPVDSFPNYIELSGYSLDFLYGNLKKIGAKSVLVLIDACFSGTSENGSLVRNASALGLKAKMPKTASRFTILTAAQGSQMARWDRKAKMGLFTSFLLRGLYGGADRPGFGNGDGRITLAEIRKYLDREMTRRARRDFNQDQTAYIDGTENYVFGE